MFPGDVPVPAELPRDIDSDYCGSGGVVGEPCRACGIQFLDKHADDVRDGARHRLVADDAIVVAENVERVMTEVEGLPPKEATRKLRGQIQGALVGIAMVLSAVFIPMAFFGGSTGAIYRRSPSPYRRWRCRCWSR